MKTFLLSFLLASCSFAQSAVPLGTAANFAVLAGSTVTNTGTSLVTGNVGVAPGSAITGFPPGVVTGALDAANAASSQAQGALVTAYNYAAGEGVTTNLTGQNLGGLVLGPGVYHFANSAQLTGILTLNGGGNQNAVFVFQIGTTLTTASSSRMVAENGAQAANIFWQVGSSATLGTSSTFLGNILALTSVTATTSVSMAGRLLAINGAVTMDTISLTYPPAISPGGVGGPSVVPAPSSWMLLLIGLACALLYRRLSRRAESRLRH